MSSPDFGLPAFVLPAAFADTNYGGQAQLLHLGLPAEALAKAGAEEWNRTTDTTIFSRLLYP